MDNIYISKELLLRHIEKENLDLTEIPDFPKLPTSTDSDTSKSSLRLLGVVSRCKSYDSYVFVITNQFGINDSTDLSSPVQIHLPKSHCKDSILLKEGSLLTFEIIKQPGRKRHSAKDAHLLSCTEDDYNICRNYLETYNKISGYVNGSSYQRNIGQSIHDIFYKQVEGRRIVLNDLYNSSNAETNRWNDLFSEMSEEELSSFEFDQFRVTPSADLRLILYRYSKNIDWIKDSCIIDALVSENSDNNLCLEELDKSFLSDSDKEAWLSYISMSDLVSDELCALLFSFTIDFQYYDKAQDKGKFINTLSRNNDIVSKLLKSFSSDAHDINITKVVSRFDDNTIISSLIQLDEESCVRYLSSISNEKVSLYLNDSRLTETSIKDKLLSSKEGRKILINQQYYTKSNDASLWENILSHFPDEEKSSFVFDVDIIKPSAELRLCLYRHLNSLEWLKHPCVISYVSRQESENATKDILDLFLNENDKKLWLKYVSESSISSERLKLELFCRTNDVNIYNSVNDKKAIYSHYNNSTATEIKKFLKFAFKNLDDKELILICTSLGDEKLIPSLQKLSKDDCIQLINRLPKDYAIKIVTSEEFNNSEVSMTYIGDKWDTLKSELQYVVFDLESNGDSISEFAFCTEDNMRSYTGEDQLGSMLRKLKRTKVVVGHNIKQWDLPILVKKGLEIPDDVYVWDTLEMEILLNPTRYAYSLHTEHNAEADTKLTNDLFWNQLYRLASDHNLVEQLANVLPEDINSVLSSLQIDYFSTYFAKTANLDQQFFQELRPLSTETVNELNKIASLPNKDSILIIAPENIWSRLAQYIPLSFPNDNTYYSIDIHQLQNEPFDNIIRQTILERFCNVSKTPLIDNIAQYLRTESDNDKKISFTDEELYRYRFMYPSNIDCVDVNAFDNPAVISKDYKYIFLIGTELSDRIHKCKACEDKSFADLLACGSKLPFTMASTNYAPVKGVEIEKLGIEMPELAANVWVERMTNGNFAFYLNYQYQAYRANFLKHFNVTPKTKKWKFKGADYGHVNLTQVSRNKRAEMVMRVSTSTTQRSKYWLFQFALIEKIHNSHPDKPIIYIINEKDEIEDLTKYASSKGYFIPTSGTGFRKLEYIGHHANGMIIISKQEFMDGIGSYRTDKAFCYIWDNMDIDRYMLMWDKLPFDDDIEEDVDDERDDKVHHSTPRQCIHAAWPIYENYCSLVMANNKETQCFIIDPYFDDYEDIAESCNAQKFKVDLWSTNNDYENELAVSATFFVDSRSKEEDIDVLTAMELIRKTFIGDFNWKDTQKDVLPYMLEKKGDCIVSMPTGEGKSVCFQGPAIFKASITRRLSLVITPLRALMQDQVENLQKLGFQTNVDYLSGDRQRPEVENIYRKIRSGELALLFITPERFRVRSFINVLYQRMDMDGGLEYVIFDEAHCISQWGQEFRPDYRNAVLKCIELRKQYDFMFAMFSATVTSQVESDIRRFLPDIQRLGQSEEEYNPIRQHIGISFDVVVHEDSARIGEIVNFIEKQNIDFSKSCMIVFCRTHRQCEETADALAEMALNSGSNTILSKCIDRIGFYHAGLDADLRNDVYEQFKRTEGVEPLYILCATKAFGMGMDIPNVHYVVHYNPPSVLEDYLQEVGRAGRDEQMYHDAFENGAKQIPAICLTSQDDFKKLKELLVKSQMGWSNLTDAKDKITEYIQRFQSLEKTATIPVVVPFDVWIKNAEDFNDTTSSRLAFHWLEKIGCIRQQYLSQAHIDISVPDRNKNVLAYKNDVYKYILDNTDGERCLISINDMRSSLRMSMPRIMNQLISFMKNGLLTINESMRCCVVPRRYCEAKYMIEQNVNTFALHIVFEGLRSLLSDCGTNKVRYIGQKEREEIFKHLMDDVSYDLIKENGTNYMPWKDHIANPPKMAVLKYDTFRKNIVTRMGAQMFSILYYLPMVNYKVERQEDEVLCTIKVKNDSWHQYLQELENDCLKMIGFVVNQQGEFTWAKVIIDNGWTADNKYNNIRKGYNYFEDLLAVLHHIAYVEHSPLTKNGIEILTTPITNLPIDEGTDEQSPMHAHRIEFDNQEQIKKIRLACMNIFSFVKRDDQGDFIRRYFQSRNYEDYLTLAGDYAPENSDIMSEVTEEALKIEEEKFYGNPEKGIERNEEQVQIYEQPKNANINVLAGPGAGKTHILTLRCARLIYKEHIDPSHLLVLAYNRAVVVELRNRLNSLFTKLGMSRIAHQLHVYTFAALAKKCLGHRLDTIPTELWEMSFRDYLKTDTNDFLAHFPNIEFILVDEFQDITRPRLGSLIHIHEIFPDAKFFTIGDINQSIYGFDRIPKDQFGRKQSLTPEEYANVLDPRPYYDQWDREIAPTQLTMFTNYRSYQKILDKSAQFITEGVVPRSARSLMKYEPSEQYVYEIDNNTEHNRQWFNELPTIVNWAVQENEKALTLTDPQLQKQRHIDNIAVFFRTNNEVYRGYSKIKNKLPNGVRIRIQGESIGEFWREREVYYLIDVLIKHPEQKVVLRNDKTLKGIKKFLADKMASSPKWDSFMLDVAYCLVLNYVDSIRSDNETHTWKELADYIKDIASRDDAGQVYKIYENYKTDRILQEPVLNIVLTTMHKVKGLEFDVVITTPSFAGLPLKQHREYQDGAIACTDDLADMEEESRLMYVAYTRAKKRLYIFKASRENALKDKIISPAPDYQALRYTEVSPSLDKYFLSYSAKDRLFETIDNYVYNNVSKDEPVLLTSDSFGNYYIKHNNSYIGRLSGKSTIKTRAWADGKTILSDFYISSVFVWTYEDTIKSDEAKGTDFAKMWSDRAKQQGYINIVQIAGFGTPQN